MMRTRLIVWTLTALGILGAVIFFLTLNAIEVEKDTVYGTGGSETLRLDMARPTWKGTFPAIVCIHGGAWRSGDKSSYDAEIRNLASLGFVAVSIQYRLAPKHIFPAQVEDAKCAVRFLRANAKKYNINPGSIGALGDSAGGHLALMLGLMNTEDGLEGDGGSNAFTSKIQAVVNYYGPTDFNQKEVWSEAQIAQAGYFFGTEAPDLELIKKASPAAYIDPKDPPILTVHGTADPIVPVTQATHLHQLLKVAGVQSQLDIVQGAGHGWQSPDQDRIQTQTIQFFKTHLSNK